MPLDAPPVIPLITDPATFPERAQDWVVWQAEELYPFLQEQSGVLSLSTNDTSTTSNTIGLGVKTFTVSAGKGFYPNQSLGIGRTSDTDNRMFAVVNSYSGTTLEVNSQAFEGSGTFTDWSITLAYNGVVNPDQLSPGGPSWTTDGEFTINDPFRLGYGAGSGGSVSQLTSKTTSVTLNRPAGQITMNAAALAAGAKVTFTLNNSIIGAADGIVFNKNGAAFFGTYEVYAEPFLGGASIYVTNISAGSLSNAVVLNFQIVRGATT